MLVSSGIVVGASVVVLDSVPSIDIIGGSVPSIDIIGGSVPSIDIIGGSCSLDRVGSPCKGLSGSSLLPSSPSPPSLRGILSRVYKLLVLFELSGLQSAVSQS